MSRDDLVGKVALVTGAAAKRGMGRSIALRLASQGADVAVLDVAAAPRSLFPGDEGWRGLDELVEEIDSLGRMGTTDDIADVASFLVSKESDYMTGQSLNVCGGLLMD